MGTSSRSRDRSDRHKKQKRHKDEKERKKRHREEEKDRKKRHRKRDRESETKKRKKSRKEKNSVNKSKLVSMGEPLGHAPKTLVDPKEDYFTYHQEFWVYLFREEGIYFNDLNTKESHEAFRRFAKDYNAGRLEEPYYTRKFPSAVIEESKTTKHSWGFKTTQSEREGLDDLQKGIRKQTEYTREPPQICQVIPKRPPPNQRRLTPEERLEQKRKDKRLLEKVKLVNEELAGGPKDHRERKLEQKRQQAAAIHGAHRDREGQASGMELSDSALFGQDDFASAVAKSRARQQHSQERRTKRIEELEQKEKDRQANMLRMLGLQNLGGRKVQIAPRKDPT